MSIRINDRTYIGAKDRAILWEAREVLDRLASEVNADAPGIALDALTALQSLIQYEGTYGEAYIVDGAGDDPATDISEEA